MEKHRRQFHIGTEQVNAKGQLRLSQLLVLCQDIAAEHVEMLGYPREKTFAQGLVWVIGKTAVEISRLPVFGEEVTLETWPGQRKMFLFPRHLQMKDAKGQILFRATAMWTLLDFAKRTFAAPERYGVEVEGLLTGEEIACPSTLRFEGLQEKAILRPSFRDIDLNGHVNNTRYLDLVEDLIPVDYLLSHTPTSLHIHYRKEVRLGEQIELAYGRQGDDYRFQSDRFCCQISYKKDQAD